MQLSPVLYLIAAALVPVLVSWLVVVIPSRRREASGLVVGNPLHEAPLAPVASVVSRPFVSLSRQLDGANMAGYILGMRHLPVEQTAPLLARYVRCQDPALQLYAQSILADGREKLQARLARLQRAPADDARLAAWMLETGLTLASPTLTGVAERPGFLLHLAKLADERLRSCKPTPTLLANAVQVYLEAGRLEDAATTLAMLPKDCPCRADLQPAVLHALKLKESAA